MARIGRPGLSDEQKREVWRRWRDGQSLSEIGRALGKVPGSIHGVVAANGGFVPAARTRSAGVLSLAEREEISRGLAAADSFRAIAGQLGRAPSTVSREVGRHGGREKYRAARADEGAWGNARRPKSCLLQQSPALRDTVAGKLKEDWSPRQIAGWLARTFAPEDGMYVSHETIYKSLFIQARGVLKKELVSHLRRRRTMRRSKNASTAGQQRGCIRDAVSIRERPAEAEDRAVPGHWEGDLITGAKNSHIATLVERHSRYVMLVRVAGKDTTSVISALSHQVRYLPDGLMTSLTWDRGTELADHKRFTMATDVKVYFADPKSPWQRGSNENTNGLLRQYFPKGTDLSGYTQADLDAVALKLNTRPRQTLGFETPADRLAAAVASTG
ncbi:IS30 family transposase [Streptomyces sp. NBC_01669]|uniref:IS30 family transposase n=1 Tax=Streptomyces sp. NBC_01669 TaxID=2975909 RepID=UPI002256D955|nr:IS30 family transposase [Streptomyces sp. NBC_01669]MCX4537711.1 IS30 family transposase [Streptomyces sp. NBC_01669]MCX4538300.1 IS30 family transposase [Streptomyces sp. NBC_01669]